MMMNTNDLTRRLKELGAREVTEDEIGVYATFDKHRVFEMWRLDNYLRSLLWMRSNCRTLQACFSISTISNLNHQLIQSKTNQS